MVLDYYELSEEYRPEKKRIKIKTLLIAEAPPANGKKYFYLLQKRIRRGSLSGTVFYHYFSKIPGSTQKYKQFLCNLQGRGIFLIDISDEPLHIRDKSYPKQINPGELKKLEKKIPHLRRKLQKRGINIEDNNIIFLLPRPHYKSKLKKEFPNSQFYSWKDFRNSSK